VTPRPDGAAEGMAAKRPMHCCLCSGADRARAERAVLCGCSAWLDMER
jgi:hypothetical protein